VISGSTSSAVAIALQTVCDRERTIYLPAISGSNETTGVDCQRYGFRLCYFAYPACKAIAPVLAKSLGKDRKAIYLVPDYTYGHTTYDSMVEFTEKQGWKTVGQQVHPLGAKDYSSFLINIANSGADTLVVIAYGADAANSIKQAKQFGLLEKMNIVVPYMSAFLEKEIGPEITMALLSCMKRVAAWTAVLGLVSASATPNFTVLPSTPFLVSGEIFFISGAPAFSCSMASS
jgi:ABC-type branched-subunit amino acid transport system substrate-binding protein